MLTDDGKLWYYKDQAEAKTAKVPIDMNTLSAVSAVNGPLELELKVGLRSLRLKATETAQRDRWMAALTAYMDSHSAEREAAAATHQRRYMQSGTGIRDVDNQRATSGRAKIEGWLHRQDPDVMRRWRERTAHRSKHARHICSLPVPARALRIPAPFRLTRATQQ